MFAKRVFRSIFPPLLSLSLFVCSSAFLTTALTLQLAERAVSKLLVGLVHSSFYGGYLVGSLQVAHLLQRVGYVRSFNIFASLFAAMSMIQGMSNLIIVWFISRFIAGLSAAAVFVIIESWLLGHAEGRGKMLSLYMIVFYLSQTFGQILLHWTPVSSLAPFLMSGLLCSLSSVPVALTRSKIPEIVESSVQKPMRELIDKSPLGFFGCFVGGLVLSSIYAHSPAVLFSRGLPVAKIMALTIAGGFSLQGPIGYASDVFERRSILLLTSATLCMPCLAILAGDGSMLWTSAASFFLGGCSFAIYPLSIAEASDRIAQRYVMQVTSICSVFYGVGSVCGPLVSALLIHMTSSVFLYAFIGTAAALLAITAATGKTSGRKREFLSLPAVTTLNKERCEILFVEQRHLEA